MRPILNRLMVSMAGILSVLATLGLVIFTEHGRKLQQLSLARASQQEYTESVKKSHEEYLRQLEEVRGQNIQEMNSLKIQYEALLKEQDKLIAEHTKTVQRTEQVTTTSYETVGVVTSNSSGSTSTKSVKVTKPKSTPTTRSS